MNHIDHPWRGIIVSSWIVLGGCSVDTQTDTTRDVPPDPIVRPSSEAEAAKPIGDAIAPGHTGNCGGELTREPVELTWIEAAGRDEIDLARGESTALDVHNVSEHPVTVKVITEMNQRGAERSRELAPLALAPGAHERVAIDLDALGLARTAKSVGHLGIRATVYDASGTIIMTVHAPGRSFHDRGEGRVALYDDEVRDRKYGKGDPFGDVSAAIRNDPKVLSISFGDEATPRAAGGAQ